MVCICKSHYFNCKHYSIHCENDNLLGRTASILSQASLDILHLGSMKEYTDMTVSASSEMYEDKLNQHAIRIDEKADNISELFRNFNESLMIEGEVFSNK